MTTEPGTIGSSFDDFLEEVGIVREVAQRADQKRHLPDNPEESAAPVLMAGDDVYDAFYAQPLFDAGKEPTLFNDFKYLVMSEMPKERHFVITRGDTPAGILGIQANPYDPSQLWLKFVSVHPDHRNTGLATRLIDALFRHAQHTGQSIKRSSPSEMGAAYLTSVFNRMIALYPDVTVVAHDDHRH